MLQYLYGFFLFMISFLFFSFHYIRASKVNWRRNFLRSYITFIILFGIHWNTPKMRFERKFERLLKGAIKIDKFYL